MSNSPRNIDYFMTSLDLAHRIESVELSHGPLRPHLPVCLQLSGTHRACEFEKESMLRGFTLWKTWAHASMEGGGRAAHRWRKVDRTQHCIENTVRQGETSTDPIHIIDDEMDIWNELWQRHDKMSTPIPDGVVCDSLAVPSCDDIRGLLCHKSMRKATGIDDLPSRLVSRMSDDCLTALGEFIDCIERLRLWPPLLHVLVRVPKPTGGHRLIALLHDLAKLWCVIRQHLAAEWECLHELPEFRGDAGKSSTRAVFQRRPDSEVARELGGSSISILLDQEKINEMVPFSCLWQEALSSDFSPTICWMVLQSYGQPRVIKGLGPTSCRRNSVGHHAFESSVLQNTSPAGPATFLGFLWGPGRRLAHPLTHFQSSRSRPSQGG